MNLPKGHQQLMPYMILPNADEFIAFVEKVFNATELAMYRRDDGSVMHAEMQISGCTMMFGQSNETWGAQTNGFYLYVENVDEAYNRAIAEGAESVMEPVDKDYGRSCGVKDPSGNTWWLAEA